MLHYCRGVPILLVGLKKDLRDDPKTREELHKTGQRPVSQEEVSIAPARGAFMRSIHSFRFGPTLKTLSAQGKATAEKIDAFMYVECSAKNNDGIYEVFQVAARLALLRLSQNQRSRKNRCTLL